MTETETLSYPGASLLGMSIITLRTSEQRTGLNSNSSSRGRLERLELIVLGGCVGH